MTFVNGTGADTDAHVEEELAKSGLRVFTGEEVIPRSPILEMPEIPAYATNLDELMEVWAGLKTTLVFTTDEPEGMCIMHVKIGADAIVMPHSHSANCVYYVTSGEILLGKRRLGVGAGFYIPAEHPYAYAAGPEGAEILEIRDRTHFDMKVREVSDSRYAAVVANAKAHNAWRDL